MGFDEHAEKFPAGMSAYFQLRWKPSSLWGLELEPKLGNVQSFDWHLDYPFWSTQPPEPLFDLCPNEVLSNPTRYASHWNRFNEADLNCPLHVTDVNSSLVILDGIHRLAKLVYLGECDLQFYVVPNEFLIAVEAR